MVEVRDRVVRVEVARQNRCCFVEHGVPARLHGDRRRRRRVCARQLRAYLVGIRPRHQGAGLGNALERAVRRRVFVRGHHPGGGQFGKRRDLLHAQHRLPEARKYQLLEERQAGDIRADAIVKVPVVVESEVVEAGVGGRAVAGARGKADVLHRHRHVGDVDAEALLDLQRRGKDVHRLVALALLVGRELLCGEDRVQDYLRLRTLFPADVADVADDRFERRLLLGVPPRLVSRRPLDGDAVPLLRPEHGVEVGGGRDPLSRLVREDHPLVPSVLRLVLDLLGNRRQTDTGLVQVAAGYPYSGVGDEEGELQHGAESV